MFDNDGVLVDTEPVFIQAAVEVATEAGLVVTADDYVRLTMIQGKSVYDDLGLPQADIDALREKRNVRYGELLEGRDLVLPSVRETVAALSSRFRLAVVTSSLKCYFDVVHASSGLLQHIEFVMTHEDFVKPKPDPEPYRRALVRLGLEASACLVVEDAPRGVVSATAAGIRCVAIPTELTKNGVFSRAFRVLERFDQLGEVVDELT